MSNSFLNNKKNYVIRIVMFVSILWMAVMFSSWTSVDVFALELSNEVALGSKLTEEDQLIYSLNGIIFPTTDCVGGGSSSVCGNTAREIYWSALSQYIDDPIKIAGIVGNLMREGGMNPVAWEGTITNSDGSLIYSWDFLYGGGVDGEKGVGAFGITSGLSDYLHYINDNYPDLLKYFKESKEYSFNYVYPGSGANPTYGDTLLEKIGADEYGKLVAAEIKFAMEDSPTFASRSQEYMGESFSSPMDSAYWWASEWEICGTGCLNGPNSEENVARGREAEKTYDELKDFKCTAKSSSGASSSSKVSEADGEITLIGDSIAVQAETELQTKFPSGFMTKVGSRHSTSKGDCSIDEGGLTILEKIVSGDGTVANQHVGTEECVAMKVDSDSLKKNVVWELGTNSTGADESTMKRLIALVGQRNLFLVTPYNGKDMSGADSIAELYRETAEENDNVYVVDWNDAVRNDPGKYITTDDGMAVHPTANGRQLLADLIEEAISGSTDCVAANYKNPAYVERLDNMDTFNQWQGTWKDHMMCPGSDLDIHHNGCGMMSLMGMYYLFSGNGLDDEQVFKDLIQGAALEDHYNGCGGSAPLNWGENIENYTKMSSETLWVGEQYTDDKWELLVDALRQGKKILIGTTGEAVGGPSKFAYKWHALFLDHYNVEKDAILLFDPSMSSDRAKYAPMVGPTGDYYDGVYITREAMREFVAPDEAFPITYNGQTCLSECKDTGGSVEGGLTEEEAQRLVDYYKSDRVDADEWGLPHGKANCVSLSMWFIQAFTSIGKNGNISDNGNGVAYQTAIVGNLNQGNDPRPFSVFSVTEGVTMCGDVPCGHTGIIVGVYGDDVLTIEAAYETSTGYVDHHSKEYFVNARFGNSITYLESILNKADLASAIWR